jgi:hypothetical protein
MASSVPVPETALFTQCHRLCAPPAEPLSRAWMLRPSHPIKLGSAARPGANTPYAFTQALAGVLLLILLTLCTQSVHVRETPS